MSADHRPAALGLDVGSSRTKVAAGAGIPRVSVVPTLLAETADGPRSGLGAVDALRLGSTVYDRLVTAPRPADQLIRFLAALSVGQDAVIPGAPGSTALVVAVPEQWLEPTLDGPTAAAELCERLGRELGYPEPRTVTELLCVAAAGEPTEPGEVQVVCDVGERSVSAATYAYDGHTARLIDVECADLPGLDDALVDLLVDGQAVGDRRRTWIRHRIGAERRRQSDRAALLLRYCTARPHFGDTPAYVLPGDGLTTEALATVLEPVTETTGGVLERLASRISERTADTVVLTGGGRTFPAVADVVRQVFDGRAVVRAGSTAAAVGAHAIASGRVEASDEPAFAVGLVVRRIRHGLLVEETIGIGPRDGSPATIVTVDDDRPMTVRVRSAAAPWREAPHDSSAGRRPLRRGRYCVEPFGLRPGCASVIMRPLDGGEPVVLTVRGGA